MYRFPPDKFFAVLAKLLHKKGFQNYYPERIYLIRSSDLGPHFVCSLCDNTINNFEYASYLSPQYDMKGDFLNLCHMCRDKMELIIK